MLLPGAAGRPLDYFAMRVSGVRMAKVAIATFMLLFAGGLDAHSRSSRIVSPGLWELAFNTTPNYEHIVIAVGLDWVESEIAESVRKSLEKQGGKLGNVVLHANHFVFANNDVTLVYRVDVDTSHMRCEIFARFAIPRAPLVELGVQETGSTANCRTGLPDIFDLATIAEKAIMEGLRDGLNSSLADNNEFLQDWSAKDPVWFEFMKHAHVQARFCRTQTLPRALCLYIAWLEPGRITNTIQFLIGLAPKPSGAADRAKASRKVDDFIAAAKAKAWKQSKRYTGYFYPAEWKQLDNPPRFNEGDMALFGGLLCLAGEPEGCELLHRSRDAHGRFWRSPDLIGDTSLENTFSGDQFNGAAAYLLIRNDPAPVREFLAYLRAHEVPLPSPQRPTTRGYKSCENDKDNTCLLAGPEWHWLNKLALKHGLVDLIPQDERDVERRFGFSYSNLVWQALLNPAGFRLHLTGVQVLLARAFGDTDPLLTEAAAILAARQPNNPFFLYLHLGADTSVDQELDRKCSPSLPARNYDDWAWQRAETAKAWNDSILWDCVFMYRLLSGRRDAWVAKPF